MRKKTGRKGRHKGRPKVPVIDKSIWKNIEISAPVKKKHISIRIDEDVLAWFQAQGRGYQGRMNAVLRSFMDAEKGA